MAKKQQPPNPVEQLQSYYDRWDNLYEHGGSDPFYADGSGLNMLRNQIVILSNKVTVSLATVIEYALSHFVSHHF